MTNPEAVSTVEIAEAAEQAVASSEEAGQKKSDERPSILFCCPGSVLDTTSGAAVSLRTILEALADLAHGSFAERRFISGVK